jgi:hypothetical protein
MHGRRLWSLFTRASSGERRFATSQGNRAGEAGVTTAKENDMFGKIIGAIAGSKMAKRSSNVSEPMGAVAGLVTASALRRISLPAIIALAAGGYAAKKLMDRKQAS